MASFVADRLRAFLPSGILAFMAAVPPPDRSGRSLLGLPGLCPSRWVTGIPCPGCGMTRSLVCCAHWDFARAAAMHPLGPVVFAGLVGWAALSLLRLRRPDLLAGPRARRAGSLAAAALGAALLVLWPLRLLHIVAPPP